jgi:hypothetical protein
MGCFKGSKYKTEAVSPEQEQMYKMMAQIMQGGAQNYQSKPMWSAGADPGQLASQDYLQRQLGYGGYQQPGFYTAGSQNVRMPGMNDPNTISREQLQAPWLRGRP